MKKNVIKYVGLLILGFVLGVVVAGLLTQKTQKVLDNSRYAMIEFNKEYNRLYNQIGYYAIAENNENAKVIFGVLQELGPELFDLNRSLKLDCKEYQENGKPLMSRDNNGVESPVEKLPEEVRIAE